MTIERIMGFGNSYLFYYLTHANHLFIDATFSVAPKPFYQCLIVMIFYETLQIYIPILYILMTNKSKKWIEMHSSGYSSFLEDESIHKLSHVTLSLHS